MDRPTPAGELVTGAPPPPFSRDPKGSAPAANLKRAPLHFELATPAHDAALRQLLRDNPMRGAVTLSLEREPDYFAAAPIEGHDHRTIVALEHDRVLCAGSVSTRLRFVNGHPTRVGYLGGLRLDAAARGRSSILLRGYAMFRKLHEEQGGPPFYLTSIAADNRPALRLLERGLSGLPTYRFVGDLVTLVIRRRRNRELTRRRFREDGLQLAYGREEDAAEVAKLLRHDAARFQFAPAWCAEDFLARGHGPGPRMEDFRLLRALGGAPVACAALWDQRGLKQTVVRGYAAGLRRLRPFLNSAASLLGLPRLPAVGEAIRHAYVSHAVTPHDRPELAALLLRLFFGPAQTRGIDYLTLAFDARDPRLPHLRKAFHPREYATRLYAVHWPDGASAAAALDDRLLAPEVATL